MTAAATPDTRTSRFVHDALFYADLDSFVRQVGAYVRDGVEAGQSVLVAVDAPKGEALRDHLGESEAVQFIDITVVGRNPGRIIPVWHEFLAGADRSGRGARGVGEPVWRERTPAELAECQLHETLLNLAFDDGFAWDLLCPYDVSGLAEDVLQEAMRSHPSYVIDDVRRTSSRYVGSARLATQLAAPLDPPVPPVTEVAFSGNLLGELRDEVVRLGEAAEVPADRLDDLALVVHELATNSVRHGGGEGRARLWRADGSFVVEIADGGFIADPLVGRERPPLTAEGGRGVWLAHHLSDLIQLRTSPEGGTVVRASMRTA